MALPVSHPVGHVVAVAAEGPIFLQPAARRRPAGPGSAELEVEVWARLCLGWGVEVLHGLWKVVASLFEEGGKED